MTALPSLALALFGFLLTALLVPFVRRGARRFGLVDDPTGGAYKTHGESVPYGGGIAIFLGGVLPLLGFLLFVPDVDAEAGPVVALAVCAGAVFAVGLLDDWRQLPPLVRLLIQLAAAATLSIGIAEFRLAAFATSAPLSAGLAVVWIVAITNAYNFLDNMDGLSAGLGVIALSTIGVLAIAADSWLAGALCLLMAGAAAGFLLFNFPPASIFLGDAGGLLLGFMASSAAVLVSSRLSTMGPQGSVDLTRGLAPLIALALPLYDLVSVILIRLRRRVPPWLGDTNHISHRLVRLGLSRRSSVLVLYGLATLTACVSLGVVLGPAEAAPFLLAGLALAVAAGAALDGLSRHRSLSTLE